MLGSVEGWVDSEWNGTDPNPEYRARGLYLDGEPSTASVTTTGHSPAMIVPTASCHRGYRRGISSIACCASRRPRER